MRSGIQIIGKMVYFKMGSSYCGTAEMTPTSNNEVEGLIPDLAQWVKDLTLP